MTKAQLFELLKDVPDTARIGMGFLQNANDEHEDEVELDKIHYFKYRNSLRIVFHKSCSDCDRGSALCQCSYDEKRCCLCDRKFRDDDVLMTRDGYKHADMPELTIH